MLDVSEPAEPFVVAFLSPQDFQSELFTRFVELHDIVNEADLLYLTPGGNVGGKLAIVDVSDPTAPVPLDSQIEAEPVALEDSILYVSELNIRQNFLSSETFYWSLGAYDITDLSNPIRIGNMATSPVTDHSFHRFYDVVVRGGYIYLAERRFPGGAVYTLRLIDPDWRPDDTPAEASEN